MMSLLFLTLVAFTFADPCYEYAPDTWDAIFATTKGNFTINVNRDWAPNAADRLWNGMHCGHYATDRFFYVDPKVQVRWGLSGDPTEDASWDPITSDSLVQKNALGYVSFWAPDGLNTANTEIFVNLASNSQFDQKIMAPFGSINSAGMQVVQKLYSGYGTAPNETLILQQGNAYLDTNFPNLDKTTANDVKVYCARAAETCSYIPGDNYAVQCCTGGEQCIAGVGCRCLNAECIPNLRNLPRKKN